MAVDVSNDSTTLTSLKGDNREESEYVSEVLRSGNSMISQMVAIEKLLKLYRPDNDTVRQAVKALVTSLETLWREHPEVEVRFWRDCIYVNDTRLRCDVSNFSSYKHLLRRAVDMEVEKLLINEEASAKEIIGFFQVLERLEAEGKAVLDLAQALEEEEISHIKVSAASESQELEILGIKPPSKRERAKKAFYSTLRAAKATLLSQRPGGVPNVRKAKRAVQATVDVLLEDESSLLAMSAIKDHDEYTFTHSVNVCMFSLAIGHRLGLSRTQLAELGIAALFHDIGKVSVPATVLNKVGMLDVDEWKTLRNHTLTGVQLLSKMPRCNQQIIRSLVVAFQHHINMDQTGYPNAEDEVPLDLYSKIVRIADTFDAMTTERPYMNKVHSPHEALQYLLSQAGTKFDPVLVKAFAASLGIFPAGTVVKLNTGEAGIVVKHDPNGEPDRPVVRIIRNADGSQAAGDETVDLKQKDANTGEYLYHVVEALSCKDVGENPRYHLLP
jgi:HD-GYP domain-containing protein (c-di-GMP phosphodiesterase class II)